MIPPQGDDNAKFMTVERAFDRHDIRIGAVEAKIGAVEDKLAARTASAESQGVRIGAVEAAVSAHAATLIAHENRMDMVSNILSTGFDIHPGSEMKDAAERRIKDAINTSILSDIRQATRLSVVAGGTLVVLSVIGLILMNGPSIIGAVGQLGGIMK